MFFEEKGRIFSFCDNLLPRECLLGEVIVMGDMAIAAVSVDLHQSQVQRDFSIGVLKMAMDTQTASIEDMLGDIEEGMSLDPNIGANLNLLV